MKEHWKKDNLSHIISQSQTQREVLIKLGLRAAGGNFKTLKFYINLYDLDTSHFRKRWETIAKLASQNKIPLNEILVENSTYNRSKLKIRLYSSGLKKRECELCGQNEEWKGKKMNLILDHINGIWNDNRIENLRIVCPNCNATLPTHCGKNLFTKTKIPKPPNYSDLKKELKGETKFQIMKKYGNTYTIKKRIKDLEILDELKKSEIDFKKFGWVTQSAKIIGIKDQKVSNWIKRVDPKFYSNCFVKNIR